MSKQHSYSHYCDVNTVTIQTCFRHSAKLKTVSFSANSYNHVMATMLDMHSKYHPYEYMHILKYRLQIVISVIIQYILFRFCFRFGPRFLELSEVYDKELIDISLDVANKIGLDKNVHEGVFTMLGGPTFETPAELRMLKLCGVDAVGIFLI